MQPFGAHHAPHYTAELVNTGRFFENTQNTVRMLAHAKYIGNTLKYAQIYRSRFYVSRHGSQPPSACYVRAARSEVCHAHPDPTKFQHLIGTHPLDTAFLFADLPGHHHRVRRRGQRRNLSRALMIQRDPSSPCASWSTRQLHQSPLARP